MFREMEAGGKISWLEDELSCPICQDIFTNPVSPPCQHNFCCACLMSYWKKKGSYECPVCRETYSTNDLKWNRTLANISESFLKEFTKKQEMEKAGCLCRQHNEVLKLFCQEDQEVMCVVCLHSRRHESHKCHPLEEATKESKEELKILMKSLKSKLEKFSDVRNEYQLKLKHIKSQALGTEKQIKQEFQKLHSFLHNEEKTLMKNLRKEEERHVQLMRQKMKEVSEGMSSLNATIQCIESELSQQDSALFLLNLPATRKRANCAPQDPEAVSAVINVGHYVGSLQYKVWKKMLNIINTASVTLDPNTAAPWLSLSDDLTVMGYSPIKQQLPDNPERFDSCVSVLGLEGFTSGRHHWDVDVRGQSSWCLGVARESIRRKGIIKVDPENGFWAIGLMDSNECYACTSPWRTELSINPTIIRVYLDYKAGKVSFYSLENMTLLYTFTDSFTEKLYPYFCPYLVLDAKNVSVMKIYPQKVVLQD
ncbi:zinc-binding protein A33-like [Carcharodon carcharias]|uniref:zinc-binding protein A33-like n=1 Tax=Carcharodon carcharias TaxID=13397 RepID=UPI001B7D9334|nr:zinc-binding protein A33-like [Carcharodon carcharias]